MTAVGSAVVELSTEELAAIAAQASADTEGVPADLLDGYLETLVDVSLTGRLLGDHELPRWRKLGAQAAERGVPMRGLIDLYLSATWMAWTKLPGVRQPNDPSRLGEIGELLIRASDVIIRTLADGYEEVQRWATRQEESLRREFIDDLLEGHRLGDLAERAERIGLHLPGTHVVAVARTDQAFVDGGPVAQQVDAKLQAQFGPRNVLVSTKDGMLVCLAPHHLGQAPDEFVRQLVAALGETGPWRVGIGQPQTGPGGAVRSFDQARNALDIGYRLGLEERVLRSQDLLVYQVLRRDSAALHELVTEVLESLHDSRVGAEVLLNTLQVYFMSGNVMTETAERLHIAVRTVAYRLRRVKELTGYSIDDPAHAFTLQVAVMGARLIGWPDEDGAP